MLLHTFIGVNMFTPNKNDFNSLFFIDPSLQVLYLLIICVCLLMCLCYGSLLHKLFLFLGQRNQIVF